MTKKDYVLIARALNIVACNYAGGYPEANPQKVLEEVSEELSKELERENPLFEKDRFFDAVFKK